MTGSVLDDATRKRPVRVGVFVDWQNCYRTARDAFGFKGSGIEGNVKPLLLARLLARARRQHDEDGILERLRIYTGRASQKMDRQTYAANRRQFQAWESADPNCVKVIARTLDYKLGRPREKGIDVQIAIDLIRTSLFENEHDVAVLFSADTDLVPALELIVQRSGPTAIEVATWKGPYWSPKPLAVAGVTVRQIELTRDFYDKLADPTDYGGASRNIPSGSQLGGLSQKYPYGRRPRQP